MIYLRSDTLANFLGVFPGSFSQHGYILFDHGSNYLKITNVWRRGWGGGPTDLHDGFSFEYILSPVSPLVPCHYFPSISIRARGRHHEPSHTHRHGLLRT